MIAWRALVLAGFCSVLGMSATRAQASTPAEPSPYQEKETEATSSLPPVPGWEDEEFQPTTNIPRIEDLQHPVATLEDLRAQVEAATVQVTNITLNRTDSGAARAEASTPAVPSRYQEKETEATSSLPPVPGWEDEEFQPTTNIPRIEDLQRPATTLQDWYRLNK